MKESESSRYPMYLGMRGIRQAVMSMAILAEVGCLRKRYERKTSELDVHIVAYELSDDREYVVERG